MISAVGCTELQPGDSLVVQNDLNGFIYLKLGQPRAGPFLSLSLGKSGHAQQCDAPFLAGRIGRDAAGAVGWCQPIADGHAGAACVG